MTKAVSAFAVFLLASCSSTNQAGGQSLDTGTFGVTGGHGEAATLPMRSPVPGGCSEPAARNVGRPGCFMAAEITIAAPPRNIYWSAYAFPSAAAAAAAVAAHQWSATTQSHGIFWAHVLASKKVRLANGRHMATVGPMALSPGAVRARFIESNFAPGMRTSVHSHPGPEGFFVLDGEQCMEMPTGKLRLGPGQTLIVPANRIHFQSAPKGRRNVAVVFYPPDRPWMKMEAGWSPTSYCNPDPG